MTRCKVFSQKNDGVARFVYFDPQIEFCGWAYEMNFCIWNFMPISKNREKRRSVIEVQITK